MIPIASPCRISNETSFNAQKSSVFNRGEPGLRIQSVTTSRSVTYRSLSDCRRIRYFLLKCSTRIMTSLILNDVRESAFHPPEIPDSGSAEHHRDANRHPHTRPIDSG